MFRRLWNALFHWRYDVDPTVFRLPPDQVSDEVYGFVIVLIWLLILAARNGMLGLFVTLVDGACIHG